MTLSVLFWVLYIVSILFHAYIFHTDQRWYVQLPFWVLVGLLGWGVFGAPIK